MKTGSKITKPQISKFKFKKMKSKNWKNLVLYGFVFLFFIFLFVGLNTPNLNPETQEIPLSQAVSDTKDAGVDLSEVTVTVNDRTTLNNTLNILISILPILLMVGFFYFIFRQARGAQDSIFSFGQSKAKLYSKDTPKIGFDQVAGVDEAKQELKEVVDFLKNPGKYRAIGARTPKGVLMIGPSGTGKTLLA